MTGLKGANCTHEFYPYWEGDPIPDFHEPAPVNVNGKKYTRYEATQKQRAMERDIRATKRQIYAKQAMGEDTADLRAKLRAKSKKYQSFSDQAGIKARDELLKVYGDGSLPRTDKSILKQSRVPKAVKEKAKLLFDVYPRVKGDTIKPESLYKELRKSTVGAEVLEYIEKHHVSVEIYNDELSIDGMGLTGLYGCAIGNHILVNGLTCNTKMDMAKTIVHEAKHIEYDIGGDIHAECVCEYYAKLHETRKDKLTGKEIRDIIKSYKELYSNLKWRA